MASSRVAAREIFLTTCSLLASGCRARSQSLAGWPETVDLMRGVQEHRIQPQPRPGGGRATQ
jgi:hypothetical protein